MAVQAAVVVAADTPPSVVMHPQAADPSAAVERTTRAHPPFAPAVTLVATTVAESPDQLQSAAPSRPQVSRPGAGFAGRPGAGFAGRPGGGRFVGGVGGRFGGPWHGGFWRGGFWPGVFWGGSFAWFLPVLPAFCATYWWNSVPYYYYNDVYYTL